MAVKVDQGFLNALIQLFVSEEADESQELELFKADMKMIETTLLEEANTTSSGEHKNYYDILHFSPLKVNIFVKICTIQCHIMFCVYHIGI